MGKIFPNNLQASLAHLISTKINPSNPLQVEQSLNLLGTTLINPIIPERQAMQGSHLDYPGQEFPEQLLTEPCAPEPSEIDVLDHVELVICRERS